METSERRKIFKWTAGASDEDIEKEYYDTVFDLLGNNAEEMYERCYDMEDIREEIEIKKYLGEKVEIIGMLCEERGIELWK